MKKVLFGMVLFLSFMSGVVASSASTYINSDANVKVNKLITIMVGIDTNNENVDGIEGQFNYDKKDFTFVSVSSLISSWAIDYITNDNGIKLVNYDNTPGTNYISNDKIFEIILKANDSNEGKTSTVSFNNVIWSDNKYVSHSGVSSAKNISILPISTDNTLSSLKISGYSLTPSFNSLTSNYRVTVPWSITSIKINAITTDNYATYSIKGNNNLAVGNNDVDVVVTAENGSKRTYQINVNRSEEVKDETDDNSQDSSAEQNNYANLKKLSINGFSLWPWFSSDVLEYDVVVNSGTKNLDVYAEPLYKDATVKIENNNLNNNVKNVVRVIVTNADGTTKTYKINVLFNNDDLSFNDLGIKFDFDVTKYNVNTSKSLNSIDLSFITKSGKYTYTKKIDGNKLIIKVTNSDGKEKVYTITNSYDKYHILKVVSIIGGSLLVLIIVFIILKRRKKDEKKSKVR